MSRVQAAGGSPRSGGRPSRIIWFGVASFLIRLATRPSHMSAQGSSGGAQPSTADNTEQPGQQQQQQQPQPQQQQQQQQQREHLTPAGQPEARGGVGWRGGGWRRWAITGIKAVLLLELAASLGGPLLAGRRGRGGGGGSSASDSSDEDLDPADVLMDYLKGRVGLGALRLLRSDQLRQGVDNLITEDYQELGVTDRGKEIRSIVEEIVQARESGGDTAAQRARRRPERVGLGRVGPLRFRNSNTKQALAEELSPPPAKAERA